MTEPTPQPSDEQAAELAHLETLAAAEPLPPGQALAPTAATEPKPETVALLRPLIALLCTKLAPAWNITEDEQTMLAGAYALVVDKYFPDMDFGVEVNALLLTAMIWAPRLGKPRIIDGEAVTVDDGAQQHAA